jgi:zinc/manganese transport system permease protein
MFTGLMANTWIAASIVAVIAGMAGFFAVLRGETFAAHAIPNGAFAGAAGASLLGINVIWGLVVVALASALGIGSLGSKARHDVVTALTLVLMLGLGALFVSISTEYAQETYSLLFGEVFGVSSGEVWPIAGLGVVAAVAIGVAFRPLMLTSAMPEVAAARGVSPRAVEMYFLVVMALATSMTVPVVGALLMFSLMIGPAAAARSVTARPGAALGLSVAIALAVTWLSIALSYRTNWPLGFFVGIGGALFYLIGLAARRSGTRPMAKTAILPGACRTAVLTGATPSGPDGSAFPGDTPGPPVPLPPAPRRGRRTRYLRLRPKTNFS